MMCPIMAASLLGNPQIHICKTVRGLFALPKYSQGSSKWQLSCCIQMFVYRFSNVSESPWFNALAEVLHIHQTDEAMFCNDNDNVT